MKLYDRVAWVKNNLSHGFSMCIHFEKVKNIFTNYSDVINLGYEKSNAYQFDDIAELKRFIAATKDQYVKVHAIENIKNWANPDDNFKCKNSYMSFEIDEFGVKAKGIESYYHPIKKQHIAESFYTVIDSSNISSFVFIIPEHVDIEMLNINSYECSQSKKVQLELFA